MTKKKERIYLLYDGGYIYDWMAPYFDDDEYDHRSYTILDLPKRQKDKKE